MTDSPTVVTSLGRVAGRADGDVHAYLGMPYAAPPVGPLRWRPPAPARPWEGTRPANRFAAAPLQGHPPRSSQMFQANFADCEAIVMSEDCLYLNVWTPSPTPGAGLPVMVFLHGGGNRFGHGGQEIHRGGPLASRGIVVVTINMRLGGLGFLALPGLAAEDARGASGNYALQDVVAALEWVQRDIRAFGGDPGSVTLAGNSAGAAIVTHLMAAPSSRGLFHAAIGQSSSGIFRAEGPMIDQEAAQQQGLRAVTPLGTQDVDRLRDLPATAFLLPEHLGVVIDGRVVERDSEQVFLAGEQASVPLLVGTTTDEGAGFTHPSDQQVLRELVARPDRAALASHYPTSGEELAHSARAFVGETRFVHPVWRWALTHAATTSAPVWTYRFDQAPPLPVGSAVVPPADGGKDYGVFHTAELAYTGDNLDCRNWDWSADDRTVALRTADTWARFVTEHDPSGGDLPTWPALSAGRPVPAMVISAEPRLETGRREAALRALDSLPRPL